jgi:hypothetical protein
MATFGLATFMEGRHVIKATFSPATFSLATFKTATFGPVTFGLATFSLATLCGCAVSTTMINLKRTNRTKNLNETRFLSFKHKLPPVQKRFKTSTAGVNLPICRYIFFVIL